MLNSLWCTSVLGFVLLTPASSPLLENSKKPLHRLWISIYPIPEDVLRLLIAGIELFGKFPYCISSKANRDRKYQSDDQGESGP